MTQTNLRIKEILKQQKHTQKWLAERMGISPIALSKIIRRDRPDFKHLEAMATALGVTKSELFADYNPGNSISCPGCGHKITIKAE